MDLRHTPKGRRALTAVALAAGLLLAVAGCGGGNEDKAQSSSSSPASSSSEDDQGEQDPSSSAPAENEVLATAKDGDIAITITAAQRDQGGFVTVEGTVTNNGNSSWLGANWASDEMELARNGGSLSGASLVDQTDKKKYLVLRDTTGRCLCTKFSKLRSGDSADWFAQFPAPPSGTTSVDFQVGSMPPASLEISGGE